MKNILEDVYNIVLPVSNGKCDITFRNFDILHGIIQGGSQICCEFVNHIFPDNNVISTEYFDCNDEVKVNGITLYRPDYRIPFPVYAFGYKNVYIFIKDVNIQSVNAIVSKISNKENLPIRSMDVLNSNEYFTLNFSNDFKTNLNVSIPILCNDMDKDFNHVWLKLIHSYYNNSDTFPESDKHILECEIYYNYLTYENKLNIDILIHFIRYFISYIRRLTLDDNIRNILFEINDLLNSEINKQSCLNIIKRVVDYCRMVLMRNRSIEEDINLLYVV